MGGGGLSMFTAKAKKKTGFLIGCVLLLIICCG